MKSIPKVRLFRMQKGILRDRDLAEMAGVSYHSMANWLSRQKYRFLKPEELNKIARVLEVPVKEIVDEDRRPRVVA